MILFPEFHQKYGPWAFVAGASEGIGLAYAQVLAERGLNIVMAARRLEPLDKEAQLIRRRYRVEVRTVSLDLAADNLQESFEQSIADLDIGLLVYNACYSKIAPFLDSNAEEQAMTLRVNCEAPLTLCRALAPKLVARGHGGIILMSSMAGFQGSALVSTYAASKAFNTVLAESLWTELKPQGVDVLACVAGATKTPGFENSTPDSKQAKAFPMRPDAVARSGLAALGKRPTQITGWLNQCVDRVARLASRKQRTQFFSQATQDIYG